MKMMAGNWYALDSQVHIASGLLWRLCKEYLQQSIKIGFVK